MYILGIYNSHNSTASLMKDGKIIACASEERFVGIKNYSGFPKHSIDYVLKEGQIKSEDLDLVVIPFLYRSPMYVSPEAKKSKTVVFFNLLFLPINFIRKILGEICFYFSWLLPFGRLFFKLSAITIGAIMIEKEKKYIAGYLGINKNKVIAFDHHLSHAATAYYASKFSNRKCLVLTVDGEGDLCSASVNIFDGKKIKVISRTSREYSLGWIYGGVTEALGMKINEHEYKVMGLAAYVKSDVIDKYWYLVKDLVHVDLKNLTFKTSFNTIYIKKFINKKLRSVRFDITAALFQRILEEKITIWVKESIKKTKINTVILSGGVFMNVKLNQKIMQMPEVKEIFIMPSCGDESNVIGASYLGYLNQSLKNKSNFNLVPIKDVYWGPKITEQEIKSFIRKQELDQKYMVTKVINIEKRIAELLSKGKIIARVAGRMEFGARALGNRSILADPRSLDVAGVINSQVKNRDFWMPFAPTILYEKRQKYLIMNKKYNADYMMMTYETNETGRKYLKAAIHQYDFTARPQLVKKEFNPAYYSIIKEFEKITGVSALLNTSFNLHGFPIVCGPQEALTAFENSGLTHLVLENYLIVKRIKKIIINPKAVMLSINKYNYLYSYFKN